MLEEFVFLFAPYKKTKGHKRVLLFLSDTYYNYSLMVSGKPCFLRIRITVTRKRRKFNSIMSKCLPNTSSISESHAIILSTFSYAVSTSCSENPSFKRCWPLVSGKSLPCGKMSPVLPALLIGYAPFPLIKFSLFLFPYLYLNTNHR